MSEVVPMKALLTLVALLAATSFAGTARAGIPECNGIRLEDASGCELRGSLDCEAGCRDVEFKLACSASLHASCRGGCSLDADIQCTGDCSAFCKQQCDAGIDIKCTHNCFNECHGACDGTCEGSEDPEQCRASCEATCDGECDVRCEPLINQPCYKHCEECCFGSCTAQINMECQIDCQASAFAGCETDMEGQCEASCDGDGAIFCDGEYVASGAQAAECLTALANRGMAEVDARGDVSTSGGCSVSHTAPGRFAPLWGLAGVGFGVGFAARRRRQHRCNPG